MIEIVIRDTDSPEYNPMRIANRKLPLPVRIVRRKGMMYEIEGVRYEMFPVGVFALCIGRSVQTLYAHEKRGLIPPALFRTPPTRNTNISGRLYSATQCVNVNRLYYHRYNMRKAGTWVATHHEELATNFKRAFYADRIIVDTKGEFIE